MLVVPQEQALKRWDTLPDNIREALASEHSVEILERIAGSEHIPGEKIPIISQVAGYVLMGFLHPEEVAHELQDRLKIDAKIAESISKSLNSRLFAPFKSQLEKIYAPAFETEKSKVREAPTPPPPKPTEGLKPPTLPTEFKTVAERPGPPLPKAAPAPSPSQTPKPAPKMLEELGKPDLSGMATSRMAVREVAPPKPVVPPPATPAPTRRPSTPPVSPQFPKATAPGGVKPSEPESPGVLEEIKKLEHSGAELVDVLKKKGVRPTIPARPAQMPVTPPPVAPRPVMPTIFSKPPEIKTPTAGPVMIHKESETEPIKSTTSFKIEPPTQKFESPFLKPEAAPKTARVEIGELPKWQPGTPAKTEVIKPPKVIHYSALQTPVERPPKPPSTPLSAPRVSQTPLTPLQPGSSGLQAGEEGKVLEKAGEKPRPPGWVVTGFTPQTPSLPAQPVGPSMPNAPAQMTTPPKISQPPKVATVNYGLETREEPEKSRRGWFKSIFSKKPKPRGREVNFTPLDPKSFGLQGKDLTEFTAPMPTVPKAPPPQPPIQKAADIRPANPLAASSPLAQKEGMIDLGSLKKIGSDPN